MALHVLPFFRRLLGSSPLDSSPEPLILPSVACIKPDDQQEVVLAEILQKPRDFCIKVENQTIHVHKSVLCAVSDYFRIMLESGMKESTTGKIQIQHTKANVVETMIGHFYGKDACIEWEQIRDYVDIIELWQLAQLKPILEAYIAKNIVLQDCIDWFIYADTYHMEHVILRITELINANFTDFSRSRQFKSLSLSTLIPLISHKNILHKVAVLEGCIGWVQAKKSSRQQEFSTLLSHIRCNECNPAYLKRMLHTYSDSLAADQATKAKIQEAIASSFILIGRSNTPTKVFYVNLDSNTVSEIGCITDFGILYGSGSKGSDMVVTDGCLLLDLVSLKVRHLPSLPECLYRSRAVAMGSKIFMNYGEGRENGVWGR